MKTKKQKLVAMALVMLSATFTLSSCEKQNNVTDEKANTSTKKVTLQSQTKIDSLKIYISNLLAVDVNAIEFDEEKKQFVLNGKQTMKLEEIEKAFRMFPTVNYENGKNVDKK